ncbi:hypothetical protein OOK27_48010 [Streptomyces canus]|uniref:hypothetical protein n=1 Tax=Streptomyces canus TaxID=58343 RepID=UPI002255B926|nr:hypothetical protein [Streptomyces canus]MCX5261789.1 hypothetical protein [Streptomyces canus]
MTQTRFTVPDESQRHPELVAQLSTILPRVAPTVKESIHLPPPAVLEGPSRMDRITSVVLDILFDLTQQAARFGSATNPWAQLAVYDVDDFASFTGTFRSCRTVGTP